MNCSLVLWTLVYWCCLSKSHFHHFRSGLQITWYQISLLRSKQSTISKKEYKYKPFHYPWNRIIHSKAEQIKKLWNIKYQKTTPSCKSTEKPCELCSQFSIIFQNFSSKHLWIYTSDLVIHFFSYIFSVAKKLLSPVSCKIQVYNIPHPVGNHSSLDWLWIYLKAFCCSEILSAMVQRTPVSLNPTLTCCSLPPGDNSASNCSQPSLKSFFSDSFEENKKAQRQSLTFTILWPEAKCS